MENTDDPLQIDVIYTKLENGTVSMHQVFFFPATYLRLDFLFKTLMNHGRRPS